MTTEEAKLLGAMLGGLTALVILVCIGLFFLGRRFYFKRKEKERLQYLKESDFTISSCEKEETWYDLYLKLLLPPAYNLAKHLIEIEAISSNCVDIPCEGGYDWYASFDEGNNHKNILPYEFTYNEYKGKIELGGKSKGRYDESCYNLFLELRHDGIEKIKVVISEFNSSQSDKENDVEVSIMFPELNRELIPTYEMGDIPEQLIKKVRNILNYVSTDIEKIAIDFKLEEDRSNKSKEDYKRNYIKSL